MKQIACFAVLSVFAMLFAGCGQSNPYGTVKVSGKLVYEDGTAWTTPGTTLVFLSQKAPIDPKTYPRAGNAVIESDGSFNNVTTYAYGDGVIKGSCKVILSLRKETPDGNGSDMYTDAEIAKIVNPKYLSENDTPLVLDITGGKIEIKVAK